MKMTLLAAALALAGFSAVESAKAGHWSDAPAQIEVPYGDLDLNNPAGAAMALRRIKNAASKVCGGKPGAPYVLALGPRYRQCVRATLDKAVAQLNAPLVTALHTGRPIGDTRIAADGQ